MQQPQKPQYLWVEIGCHRDWKYLSMVSLTKFQWLCHHLLVGTSIIGCMKGKALTQKDNVLIGTHPNGCNLYHQHAFISPALLIRGNQAYHPKELSDLAPPAFHHPEEKHVLPSEQFPSGGQWPTPTRLMSILGLSTHLSHPKDARILIKKENILVNFNFFTQRWSQLKLIFTSQITGFAFKKFQFM